MAFFAQTDGSGQVTFVAVSATAQYLIDRLGGTWVETFDSGPEVYAGIGRYHTLNSPDRFLNVWAQPDSPPNGYAKGQWMWLDGPWRSNHANNTNEPAAGANWRQYLEEYPQWINPNGAGVPYYIGDKVTQATKHWVNTVDGNTATPSAPSSGWTEVVG